MVEYNKILEDTIDPNIFKPDEEAVAREAKTPSAYLAALIRGLNKVGLPVDHVSHYVLGTEDNIEIGSGDASSILKLLVWLDLERSLDSNSQLTALMTGEEYLSDPGAIIVVETNDKFRLMRRFAEEYFEWLFSESTASMVGDY